MEGGIEEDVEGGVTNGVSLAGMLLEAVWALRTVRGGILQVLQCYVCN